MLRTLILSFIAVLFFTSQLSYARAELQVTVLPERGTINETFVLTVSIAGKKAGQLTQPRFERSAHFAIRSAGTSTKEIDINGNIQYSINFNFNLYPSQSLKPGKYTSPKGAINIDGIQNDLAQVPIEIVPAPSTQPALPQGPATSDDSVQFSHYVDINEPYIGQQITYVTKLITSENFIRGELSNDEPERFWREQLGNKEKLSRRLGQGKLTTLSEVLIPTESGVLEIPARQLHAEISTGLAQRRRRRGFFGLSPFSERNFERRIVKKYQAPAIQVKVKELPTPPDTNQKYIPTGKLKISSKVDKKEIRQDESLTLTVTVSGDGNLRPLELPNTSENGSGFKRYDDKPKLTTAVRRGKLHYRKKFSTALVPIRSGKLKLPKIAILYFNPESASYETIETKEMTINVSPGSTNQSLSISGNSSLTAEDLQQKTNTKRQVEIIGQGLLPQHEGRRTLVPKKVFPTGVFWLIVLTLPILAITALLYLKILSAKRSDPEGLLQLDAGKTAINALNQLNSYDPESVYSILIKFVGHKFRVKSDSLTIDELCQLLLAKTTNKNLADKFQAMLEQLQNQKYSGQKTTNSQQPNQRIKDVIKLVKKVDKISNG